MNPATVGRRWPLLCIAALILGAGSSACSDTSTQTAPEVASPRRAQGGAGRILYLTYCESCHGFEGRGNGRVASSLRAPPADLTRLWETYGTPLDRDRLVEYIDGRRLITAHGPHDMPIWGDEFFEGAPPTTPSLESTRRQVIRVLAEYLETLQSQRAF